MPRPLLLPPDTTWGSDVARVFFASMVPHCFKNNWVQAALGIVHIAVIGRLHSRITSNGGMSGLLLLKGEQDTGKTTTMKFAEWLHGMNNNMVTSTSTMAAVNVRLAQMGGLAAVCWDDVTEAVWRDEMSAYVRSVAGGGDAVKMNTQNTYNPESYSNIAISVRRTRSPPFHVHSPACRALSSRLSTGAPPGSHTYGSPFLS